MMAGCALIRLPGCTRVPWRGGGGCFAGPDFGWGSLWPRSGWVPAVEPAPNAAPVGDAALWLAPRRDRFVVERPELAAGLVGLLTGARASTVHSSRLATTGDGGGDPSVRIWDPTTGQHHHTIDTGHRRGVERLVVAPDGSWLATTANDTIKIHTVDGQLAAAMRIDGSIHSCAWLPTLDAYILWAHPTCTASRYSALTASVEKHVGQ